MFCFTESKPLGLSLILSGFLLFACSWLAFATDSDKDRDGIPDTWETDGVDVTLNGQRSHIDLKKLGATPDHKDIFVWVVWMENTSHSHRPYQQAIDMVTTAFKNAPITDNPDGQKGMNLHIVFAGDVFPHASEVQHQDFLGQTIRGQYDWTQFNAIEARTFPHELEGVFHFCAFIHEMGGTDGASGLSKRIHSYDFIVSLGGFSDINGQPTGNFQDQAGTFMHELGHNIGLHHGGSDDFNNKPNYLSVMNYLFQLTGLNINGKSGNFDYSRYEIDLDETHIDVGQPMTSNPDLKAYGSAFACQCNRSSESILEPKTFPSMTAVHPWCPSTPTSGIVGLDVNGNCNTELLKGQDDWKAIRLAGLNANFGVAPPRQLSPITELTPAKAQNIPVAPVSGLRAQRIESAVVLQWTPKQLERCLSYKIYRQEQGQLSAVEIGTSATPAYIDSSTVPGRKYTYSVTASIASYKASDIVRVASSEAQVLREYLGSNIEQLTMVTSVAGLGKSTVMLSDTIAVPKDNTVQRNSSASADSSHSKGSGQTTGSTSRTNTLGIARQHDITLPAILRETEPSNPVTIE